MPGGTGDHTPTLQTDTRACCVARKVPSRLRRNASGGSATERESVHRAPEESTMQTRPHTVADRDHTDPESRTAMIRPRHPGNPGAYDPDPPLPYGRQGHPGNPS